MGTLMKYEFIRSWSNIFWILVTAIGLEIGFLVTWWMKSDYIGLFFVGLTFLMAFTVFFIYLNGIKMFSDDLNKKEGYMIFMTPNSAYKIMGAKLLSVICIATGLSLFMALLFVIDGLILGDANTWSNMQLFFQEMNVDYGIDVKTMLGMGAITILYAYLSLVVLVIFGYFAISLSATLFQNIKRRGVITFFIIVGLLALISWLEMQLGWGNISMENVTTVQEFMIHQIPSTILEVVCAFFAFLGSGYLLDHKISL